MIIPIEFTDKEIRQYLKDLGYEIKSVHHYEDRMETDEFFGGTHKVTTEVALLPGQKVKKEIHKIAVCGNTPSYPQEYTKIFQELMSFKYKKIFLEVEYPAL